MHPFKKYAVPVGITLVVLGVLWWLVSPVIAYLRIFWPMLAIAVAVGLFFWARTVDRVKDIVNAVGQASATQPLRGILIGLLLTLILGYILWLLLSYFPPYLVEQTGISLRFAWIIAVALGFPAIQFIWMIYQVTGLPGDPAVIGKAFRALALLVLIFFGWWYYTEPYVLFDHKTGQSEFWVTEKEDRVYFSEGFSPATGEELKPGAKEDAKRVLENRFQFKNLFEGVDSPVWKMLLFGTFLLLVSFIPNIPAKKLISFIGVLVVISGLLQILFPEIFTKTTVAKAQVVGEELVVQVPLLGEDNLSKKTVDINSFPPGWDCRFEGPDEAKIHFDDGLAGPITKDYGVKGGRVRFSGPVGEKVVIRCFPPG